MCCRGVVLAFSVALLFLGSVEAGSGSQESRDKFSKRGSCVKKDQNGDCPLKEGLHNASLQLSGSDLVNFNVVVDQVNEILSNASLTDDEQISACGYLLLIFFKHFNDFCDVAQQVDGEQTEGLLFVGSDGDCDVTRALKHKCAAASSGMQLHECQWLVSQIHSVIIGSDDVHYKHVLIEEVFQDFEAQFGAADFEAFSEIQITSFGFLGQFRRVCKQFHRLANIHNLFMGGNNCAFLQGINASAQDSNAPWSRSDRTQLLDFISSLQIVINDNTLADFDKMRACVHAFRQFLLTFEFMEARMRILISVGSQFNFGSFGDFFDCFSFMSVIQPGVTGVPGAPVSGATQVSGATTAVSQTMTPSAASSQGVTQMSSAATQFPTQSVSPGTPSSEAIAGQSQCIMANDMTNDCSNSSYGLTRAEQTSTLDLISNIQAHSQQAGIAMTIAQNIVIDWKQFLKINNFLFASIREFSIFLEVIFGSFGDFLDCFDIMCVLNPSGTEVPSLPPMTTPMPPTTTMMTGNCATAGPLFQLNNNHSIVVDSLYTDCNSYNGTQCVNFKPYILKIDNSVVRNTTLTTDGQRINAFAYIITQYCGTNSQRLFWVMNSQMSNGWGSVQQLCNCNGTMSG
ncbi:hypothetical protein QR680_015969 [Steinernema hermaphroditum]|uniref:Uncharacterized protein n=1 Tax=Steinernema hermaphroditum TaxID=289476 RepID=A0AA39H9L0_9BILA|nr:hypothetical protein QR680_015969 [Steinernema hermaphroditum]